MPIDQVNACAEADSGEHLSELQECKLQSIADIRFSNVDKVSRSSEKPVRLCNYMDVYTNDYIDADMNFMQATATDTEIERFGLKSSDVIITKDSEKPDDIGISTVVDTSTSDLVCGYHLALLRPNQKKVDPTFLAKQLNHPLISKYFFQQANGTTRYGLSSASIADTPLWLPRIEIQKYCSAVMRLLDKCIAHTEAVIAKLKKIREGILHDLLTYGLDEHGQIRDPVAHPEQFKDSPLGRIPKDWKVQSLGNVSLNGGSYGSCAAAKDYIPHLPRYIRITDILDNGKLDSESIASISEHEAEHYMLEEGDLLFARSGATVGKTYLYRKEDGCCAHAGYVIKFKINNNKALADFVFYWTKSLFYWSWVKRMFRQGAQPNINANEYSKHLLKIPCLNEQRRIVEMLYSYENQIDKYQLEFYKLNKIRFGLQEDLLSGRVLIPENLKAQLTVSG